MACFENAFVKRGLVLACAGALALAFGAVAAPDEAAAQCTIVNTTDSTDVTDFDDLRTGATHNGDDVAVDCTDSIDSGDIETGAVGSDEIATGAVTTDEILDGTITGTDVQDGSLTGTDIQDGSIDTADLADSAVTTAKIEDGAVTTEKLADDSVTWGKLSSGVRDRIDENSEGVAIALALQNPDLVGNESFGISVNWGGFESSSAIGIAAAGVLGRDIFGAGDRLAIAGGVGFGIDEDTVGGRVGAQLSW